MIDRHKQAVIVFLLFVLVGIAVSLGVVLLKGLAGSKGVGERESFAAPAPSTAQQRELSADERALLKTPPQGATETEKAAHFAIVNRLARTAEFLDLSACYGSPLSFRVVEGAEFSVKNNDTVAHTLQISPEHIYTVPAKEEKKLTAQFGKGPGVYGYGCDNSPDARGILFVVQ